MKWEDERYVRVYTRDTSEWSMLSWQARALFLEVLRKADRSGRVALGRHGVRGLASLIRYPVDVVEAALPELVDDGCVALDGHDLVVPNFVAAQEARKSDAQRKREQRERDRDERPRDPATDPRDQVSQNVTESHAESRAVTGGHAESQSVTPSLAQPSLAQPSPPPGGHRARDGAHTHESPPPLGGSGVDRDLNPENHPAHGLDSEPSDAAASSGRHGAPVTSDDAQGVGDESTRPEADSVAARLVLHGTNPGSATGRPGAARQRPDPATAAVLTLLEERRELRGIARLEAASRLAGFCREHGHQGKYSLADVLTCIEQSATKLGDREASTGIAPTQREIGDLVFAFVKAGPKPPARASPARRGAEIRQQGAAHEYPVEVLPMPEDDEGAPA